MMALFGMAKYIRSVLSVTGQLTRWKGNNSEKMLELSPVASQKELCRNTDSLPAMIHQVGPLIH